MDFEIEFFRVGEASRPGDAITVRYGNSGIYEVMVIDGGTEDSGVSIVKHVREVYGPDTIISHMVSTHPDSDHSSGLRHILEELPVDNLWVHSLWHHAGQTVGFFEDTRWTPEGLAEVIKEEYPIIADLFEIAEQKGIPVYEPFAGNQIGPFTVLSPTRWSYQHLMPQFRKTPAPNVELIKQRNMWLEQTQPSGLGLIRKAVEKVMEWVPEQWGFELLQEGGVTAAENETSTVLYGDFDSSKVLMTADAGINALRWACDYAEEAQLDLEALNFIQVPHHGSRRNVSPTILDRIVGPKLPQDSPEKKKAVVSAPKDDESHPRRVVMNAFLRRGAPVRSTQNSKYRYHSDTMPERLHEVEAKWQRYWEGAPYPEVVKRVPHVAFVVEDLEDELKDKKVIIQPNSPR